MPQTLCKGDNAWYVHTSMLNMCQISSFVVASDGAVAKFSSFANFEERKRKSNLLMSFPKIVHQMGSFGQIRKNLLFRFCQPILDIFGLTLLSLPGWQGYHTCEILLVNPDYLLPSS